MTSFKDHPLTDQGRAWNGTAAEKRVRAWADAKDGPNGRYRSAHLWYDRSKPDNFGSYKLLIADVVDGELRVVPRAVMAAGAVLDGARGGIDISEADRVRVRRHLARYYRRFGQTPPWAARRSTS